MNANARELVMAAISKIPKNYSQHPELFLASPTLYYVIYGLLRNGCYWSGYRFSASHPWSRVV